ncbi:MAG: GIY-YIG nuclease family protein [Patescibacteria group bacterium]
MNSYYVYIISNDLVTVLYIGVTNDLLRRVYEHKKGLNKGFSSRYHLHKLLYFEETDDVTAAIAREKQLKNWHRQWKINLIKKNNQKLVDLSAKWFGDPETSSG